MTQWKLKVGAVPRISQVKFFQITQLIKCVDFFDFIDCPSYLSKPLKQRKPPKDRSEKRSTTEDIIVDDTTSAINSNDIQQRVRPNK